MKRHAAFPNMSGWKHGEVLELLRNVHLSGNVPNGVRLALIIEGGALRGVVSCGYALGLAEFISDRSFRFIYGASSGALNAIYLTAHSLDLAMQIYAENATDPRCTNLWKFPNVLNSDWLVDNWMFGPRQFDIETFRASPSDIRIVLTRLDNGEPCYFDAKHAPLQLLRQAMKATAYAPLLTEKSQTIDGVAYGDGAIGDSLPYQRVVSEGATHVVCLTTRPENYRKRIGPFSKHIHRLRLVRHTRTYLQSYFDRPARYNESLDLIYGGGKGSVPTLVFRPQDNSEIPSSLETRPPVIHRLGALAARHARTQLEEALRNDSQSRALPNSTTVHQ